MMENKNYNEVIGSTSSPYINALASQNALATNFRNSDNGGSLPNYLTLLTGSGIGWASCNAPPSQCSGFKALTPSLVENFDSKGVSWKAYMEDMPSNCYAGNSEYYSGSDGSVYYPRHNPFIYLAAVINNQSDCNKVVPAGSADSALLSDLSSTSTASSFMWLTPNGCNQSHDCTAVQGDSYLSTLLPKILSSTIFRTQNAALFLTWDEASSGSHIPTILAGPAVKAGYQSNASYEHFSMLKTIEANWNMNFLTSNDAGAVTMSEFFKTNIQSQIVPSTGPTGLSGWGGVRLEEAGQLCPVSGSPNSSVFPGECASSMELHMAKFRSLGYNIIRVDFVNQCNSPVPQMGPYSATNLDRAIRLAKQYGLWIIVDWHGYHDLEPTYLSCWLSKWKPIVQQFMSSYTQIIWEPENEPVGGTNNSGGYLSLAELTSAYQQWIDQARSLGDTHYIVVPNICANTCNSFPSGVATGWPIVHDPTGHVFINEHAYLYYPYWSLQGWNNATAERAANMFYSAIKKGMQLTGFPALATENGAAWISGSPPDIVIGSAGAGEDIQYTRVTLHFVQTLVYLFDHNNPRINWVMWPAGLWTKCCTGGGLYGALEPGGWGTGIAPTPVLQSSISTNITNVQVKQGVALSAATTGGIAPYNYTWTFGDGTTAGGRSMNHNYTVGGDYLINLRVTDSTNVTSNSQIQVTVTLHENPTTNAAISSPIINVPPVKVANLGTPVRFTVTAYSKSPRMIVLSAFGLPKGANFSSTPGNPVSGEFSWAPSDNSLAGLHSVTFRAQESGTTSFDVKSVTIQVISTVRPCLICDLIPLWASFYLLSTGGVIGSVFSVSGLAIVRAYRPRRNLVPFTILRNRIKLNRAKWKIFKGFRDDVRLASSNPLRTTIVARKTNATNISNMKTSASRWIPQLGRERGRIVAGRTGTTDHIFLNPTAGHRLRSRAS
jgi:acid phosphatase